MPGMAVAVAAEDHGAEREQVAVDAVAEHDFEEPIDGGDGQHDQEEDGQDPALANIAAAGPALQAAWCTLDRNRMKIRKFW